MKQSIYAIRAICLIFGLLIASLAPMIPFVKEKIQLNDSELGLTLLFTSLGALIGMPITGALMTYFGSRMLILISTLAVSCILPFIIIANTQLALSLTLFLFGICVGGMNVSVNAKAVEVEIEAERPILSGILCWYCIGGIVGATLISFFIALSVPLPLCLFFASSITILILLNSVYKLPNISHLSPPIDKDKNNQEKWKFPSYHVFLLGFLSFISLMTEGTVLDWGAIFLNSNLHVSPSLAGMGYGFFSIAMAFGRFIGDAIIKKIGSKITFQLSSLLTAFGFICILTTNYDVVAFMGFGLIGLGVANGMPILFGSSAKVPEVSGTLALTIVTTFGYLGLLTGPALIGFIAHAYSLSFAFLCLTALLISASVIAKLTCIQTTPAKLISEKE